jgi:hypothetical protein
MRLLADFIGEIMKERRSLAEQHADCCIYFNGIMNEKCEANIKYPDVWKNLPCHKSRPSTIFCASQKFPTEDETRKYVEESEQHLNKMRLAFEIVAKVKKEHKGENWSGSFECPACKGILHLSHASLNGHVWGKCETEKCLAWME